VSGARVRVRVEIMGSQKYESVGKSQSALIMIDPIISPRTRIRTGARRQRVCGVLAGEGRKSRVPAPSHHYGYQLSKT
jgi:hypothetical protein